MSNDKLREALTDCVEWMEGFARTESDPGTDLLSTLYRARAALADSADVPHCQICGKIERDPKRVMGIGLGEAMEATDTAFFCTGHSTDVPPEPTKEMVEAGAARLRTGWGCVFFHDATELSNKATRDILRAALAVTQKEE